MAQSIVARGLGRKFGERVAVEDVGFEVAEGEVFGLLGPNGAGKTTTVRMLCGLLTPSAGEAEICGLRLGRDDVAIRASVGLLTEQPGLYDRLSARDNLLYFARLYRVPEPEAEQRIGELLEQFGLGRRGADKVGGFSKGMRQKLAIARALLHRPKVLFLDEPTSGLDPESRARVHEIVRALVAEGRSIVLCTHNLDEAERLCHRVAVVKGRILAQGPVSALHASGDQAQVEFNHDAGPYASQLQDWPELTALEASGNVLRATFRRPGLTPNLVARLVALGARVESVRPGRGMLEQQYLELVRGELQENAVEPREQDPAA